MNCYNHTVQPAVAQCPECGKGLCRECASRYSIVICNPCNKKRFASERSRIIKEMLLTFGVGILLAVLFVRELDAGHSYPLIHKIISYTIFTYVFSAIVPGWKTLTSITPGVFLFLPIIGWVLYFIVKFVLSWAVGLVMLPIRTVRNIARLVTIQKVRA